LVVLSDSWKVVQTAAGRVVQRDDLTDNCWEQMSAVQLDDATVFLMAVLKVLRTAASLDDS
jgi:DNA-binding winged helix-turn-helix (wHTH) protein